MTDNINHRNETNREDVKLSESEIKGLFDDVKDVASLSDDDVMKRISDYLDGIDPDSVDQEGVLMSPDDIITLTDEERNELHFVESAQMTMDGKTYAMLQQIDNCSLEALIQEDGDVYVFEVTTDENNEPVYLSVEDDSLLDEIIRNYQVMVSEYYNAQNENESL